MRTTIDLPPELHAIARQLAHDNNQSMSQVVAQLIRRGLSSGQVATPASSTRGLPLVSVGHPVTSEDVRSLEDE